MPVAATVNVAVAGAVTVVLTGCCVKTGLAGVGLTVKAAALLVTLLMEFVTTHLYCVPLLATVVAGVVYEALVAPPIAVKELSPGASCIHWKLGAGSPEAATVKVAVAGAVTVTLEGWLVMTGPYWTVRIAALLVVLPPEFVATHSYLVPSLAAVVAGVV